MSLASIFLSLFLGTNGLYAQSCPSVDSVTVAPADPRVDDAISVTAKGAWCNGFSNLGATVNVTGNTITVDVTATDGLLQVVLPWSATASVGSLVRGEYTVQVNLHKNGKAKGHP
jgi:hypothetical protein